MKRSTLLWVLVLIVMSSSALKAQSAIVLYAPADSSKNMHYTIKFVWSKVDSGFNDYYLKVSTDTTFYFPQSKSYMVYDDTTYTVSNLKYDTQYYWFVQALYGSQVKSRIFTFKTVSGENYIPRIPERNGIAGYGIDSLSIKGEWRSVENAESYQFQLSNDFNFSNLIADVNQIKDSSIVLTKLPIGRIYSRVRAVNSVGPGEWSQSATMYLHKVSITSIEFNKWKTAPEVGPTLGNLRFDNTTFEDSKLLFTSDLTISAKINEETVFRSSGTPYLLKHFEIGRTGKTYIGDEQAFNLNVDDAPFSESWINWKTAVQNGADFYDGDGDSVYNPVDKNNNGKWDSNEDAPPQLGHKSITSIYTDSAPENFYELTYQEPIGIDIVQTLYGFSNGSVLDNILFVRYKITNASPRKSEFDSMYIGMRADYDLLNYANDYFFCDTVLNLTGAYDLTADSSKNSKRPAGGLCLIEGPLNYEVGKTFTDNNGNGVFDAGIDIPLVSAITLGDMRRGVKIVEGAENLSMSSTFPELRYFEYSPFPYEDYRAAVLDYRSNLEKKYWSLFNINDPCKGLIYSSFFGDGCETVDLYKYASGDPIEKRGWISTLGEDVKNLLNFGPFDLPYGKSVEFTIAFVAAEADSPLVALKMIKDYTKEVKTLYAQGFPLNTEQTEELIPRVYSLEHNYPNPFNPSTTITYSLPKESKVLLKVYSVLGEEVMTLVNETKSTGTHKVQFDAHNLPSGVYVYSLTAGEFMSSKKMMLLK